MVDSAHLIQALKDLRAFGDNEMVAARKSNDREKYQFWSGWDAAIERAITLAGREDDQRQSDDAR